MPQHDEKQSDSFEQNPILGWMHRLDIFSELFEQKEGQYKHELDLDVILYGRGYTGGLVGPYVRLLEYEADEKLVCEGDWRLKYPSKPPQESAPSSEGGGQAEGGEDGWDGNSFYILVEGRLKFEYKEGRTYERRSPGTLIGTMMLLEGSPSDHTVTVPEGASATVLEFKRPAIRLLRKYPKFSRAFNRRNRRFGLDSALRDVRKAESRPRNYVLALISKALRSLGIRSGGKGFQPRQREKLEGQWEKIIEQWEKIRRLARFEVFDKNHVLFQAGAQITCIFMIKKGWVEVTQQAPNGRPAVAGGEGDERTSARHLGPGNCFGLEAVSDEGAAWEYTATLLARTELLTLPVEALRERPALAEAIRYVFSEFSEADQEKLFAAEPEKVVAARRSEIATGVVDGTNLLVMDMDLCVRCGNCSLACHHVHGQSRLVRRGIQIERPRKAEAERLRHVLAPNVCLHCQDPECLTGCPTGAISRFPAGQIDINPKTCIGCGDCATQCPYNAITLVARKDEKREVIRKKRAGRKQASWEALGYGARLRKSSRRLKAWLTLLYKRTSWPRLKGGLARRISIKPAEVNVEPPAHVPGPESLVAIKCNLCAGTNLNPPGLEMFHPESGKLQYAFSCEENCPTGALVRVNPREYFSEISNVFGTIYADQTRAIGRNIHKQDWPARFWHAGGILATVAVVAATVWAASRHGLNTPLPGTAWTLRWLTGFAGLLSIVAVLAYFPRKQIYRRRSGPLRYWLLAHVYSGVIGAAVLLAHGGWHSGSLLTSALMVSFDLVILSGLFGLACYKLAPRVMTRIEGAPLLIEDLRARRAELHESLKKFDAEDERLRPLIERHVRGRFFTLRYLWRQFLRRESLTVLQAGARDEFDKQADALGLDPTARALLIKAVETAAMTRRVEALIYLHRLLKLWVAPHVAFTVLMLVLLAAHLAQVFFFAVH